MPFRPLADRMRPASLDEFIGQSHLLAPGKPLPSALQLAPFQRATLLAGAPPALAKLPPA